MLSNCKPQNWLIKNEISFSFTGRSMTNITSMETATISILHNEQWKSTTLICDCSCKLDNIINGATTIEGNHFVVQSFFNEPFLANIQKVESTYLMFSFLNPDKSAFPNQYLRIDEIKSIHLLDRVVVDSSNRNWCYCANEGDYCGRGCHQPQNNPEYRKEASNAS